MENRIISSPHTLGRFRETRKPGSEVASRYSCPASLLGLDLSQIGPDPALDAFRNGNNNPAPQLPGWFSDTSFASVSLSRFHREQDAWNSLHVTGAYRNPKPFPGQHLPKTSPGFSRHGCNEPSETDSQVICSDSGYGSKRGGSAHSVISSSCPVESIPSPSNMSSYNYNRLDTGSSDDTNRPVYNASSFIPEAVAAAGVHFQRQYPQEIKCSYPSCTWTGKCPSDKKKHEARHKREWKCDEPHCTRKEGFGTINDLERHKKCVHRKIPDRGPKKVYMCFGKNCRRSSKKWPRLDNFRQHLQRVHPKENADELLRKSDEWYYSWELRVETATSLVDLSSLSSPRQSSPLPQIQDSHTSRPEEAVSRYAQPTADDLVAPSQTVMSSDGCSMPLEERLTLSPIKNIDTFDSQSHRGYGVDGAVTAAGTAPEQGSVSRQQPVELPGLRSLNLPRTLDHEPPSTVAAVPNQQTVPQASTGRALDGVVAKAAVDMINALARNLNKTSKRQGVRPEQGRDQNDNHCSKTSTETAVPTDATPATTPPSKSTGTNNDGLSDSQKKLLSSLLSAALEHLGQAPGQVDNTAANKAGSEEPDSIKQEGYQCDVCHKWKRLKCELKKHKTRHEKPYGCTFDKCYKTFGSKADWKRHENSQHFHLQTWRCSLPSRKHPGMECAHLFYRQELFVKHLKKPHPEARNDNNDTVGDPLVKNRIGRNGQNQFWCGFCRKIIPLTTKGLDAWNERFDHIDMKHFKQGQRIGDWLPAKGHRTKKEQYERAKMKKEAGKSITSSTSTAELVRGSDSQSESETESEINSLCDESSTTSSCGDSDDEGHSPVSVGLARSIRTEGITAQRAAASANVKTGNDSYNSRKRKFSLDLFSPEQQHWREENQISNQSAAQLAERNTAKRAEVELLSKLSPSLYEHPSDDDGDVHQQQHHYHRRRHVRTTSNSTEGGRHAAGSSRTRGGVGGCQKSLYCCHCHYGPWNLSLMTGCLNCDHEFCANCNLEPSLMGCEKESE
ncbi:hypothetical protein VTN77DRAFT_4918 [Rasamsonia byssochlamydoides]|uniref:uncharacterized protein n=1 Tax=Rasamsonia byssochlamydoides TaxID=89139 RepID=UPI003743E54E